ncbi:murein L,D-transpeptidase catalytic domain-containing protein [Aurantiacibacter sp. D1-12]|uniref:murein L,D-transpeptidase catalytic domain-containing protein n=1 Tax=Aurantiacibacter sp. D1-12 TaxID=2993658 RepID=UPI00237D1892|nr:murein L,D-transpeptidase catalytic domain family protein [Aurantiacibacter sp. D1-12]MDE1467198.1 murein L,D-transpeptidase catalytic domain family protein [Aurantiacibacter sp. D1-12]
MNRRQLLTSGIAASAAIATPTRVFAQAGPDARTRRLLEIARREVERNAAALWHSDVVGIADFGLHSSLPRFHFVDLIAGRVNSALVSHGSGSDPEHDGWLNEYSNLHDSWATSRGAYITWEWYEGRYGTSVRMGGLDETNSNALPRAIVLHAADYATPAHVERWGRLGRSNGCPAFGTETFPEVLYRLSGGRLIFADTLGIGGDGEDVAMPEQAPVDFETAIAERRARNAPPEEEPSEDTLAQIYAEANPGLAPESD